MGLSWEPSNRHWGFLLIQPWHPVPLGLSPWAWENPSISRKSPTFLTAEFWSFRAFSSTWPRGSVGKNGWSLTNLPNPAQKKTAIFQHAQHKARQVILWRVGLAKAQGIELAIEPVGILQPSLISMLRWNGHSILWSLRHLVGGFNHLEKYEFVNGKDDIPYIMENKIHVWKHQPGYSCG